MATFQEHLNLVKKLNRNRISEILFDVISDAKNDLIETNKKQLSKGKDSENKKLFSKKNNRGVYSKTTELLSGGKKKAGTPYDLNDTGDFLKGFFLKLENDRVLFSSKDEKTQLLIEDFGDIFGLTDEDLKAVIQKKILPFFISNIKKNLRI